jgi:hypothetical protein
MERISQAFTEYHRLSSFLIQWALVCGDSRISLAALRLFLFLDLPVKPKAALAAIRNIYIYLSLMRQTSSRVGISLMNLGDRPVSREKGHVEILEQLVLFIGKAPPSAEILLTAMDLLSYNSDNAQPIVTEAIEITLRSIDLLKAMQIPKYFTGFLPALYSASLDANCAIRANQIIASLVTRRLTAWLGPESAIFSACFAMAPFVFEFRNNFGVDFPTIKELANAPCPKSLLSLGRALVNSYQEDGLADFYVKIATPSNSTRCQAVFILAAVLLEKKKWKNSPALRNLVMTAGDLDLQAIAHPFTKAMMSQFSGCLEGLRLKKSPFPELPRSQILDLRKAFGATFTSPAHFPPLFVADEGYAACPLWKDIKNRIEQIRVEPFSDWSDLMLKAQSAPQRGSTENMTALEETEEEVLIATPEKVKAARAEMFTFTKRERVAIGARTSMSAIFKTDSQGLELVDSAQFCPTVDEINGILDITLF